MKNLLSMEDLTNEEILSLVKRALELKKRAENKKRNDLFVANLFLKILLVQKRVLKWQKRN